MFVFHPHDQQRLGDFLRENLADHSWSSFRAAVAYAKASGTRHISDALRQFAQRSSVRMTIGINSGVTTVEALRELLDALAGHGSLWIFRNAGSSTFHPKVYLFRNEQRAVAIVGSGNLTQGGLYTNYEAGVLLRFDLRIQEQEDALRRLEDELDRWSTHSDGLCLQLDDGLLQRLVEAGMVPAEAASRTTAEGENRAVSVDSADRIFAHVPVPHAPRVGSYSIPSLGQGTAVVREAEPTYENEEDDEDGGERAHPVALLPAVPAQPGQHSVFLMTLQKTDVGLGQTTRGTQRRSPEIFIPLAARDQDPQFWGWPNQFAPDPNWTGPVDDNRRGKMDRLNVPMLLGARVVEATIWYNPDKRDIRIRSESLRSAGTVGDILYLERTNGAGGYVYLVQIIPQGTAQHATYLARCVTRVRPPSQKLFGYI